MGGCNKLKFINIKLLFAYLILLVNIQIIHSQDAIYVTKSGSPDPDGSFERPYHLIESGIEQLQIQSKHKMIIGPGKYYESLKIERPCTLEATNGIAVIGELDYQSEINFDILSLNTHLAGDIVFFPTWKDDLRADDIADFLGGPNPRPDIVAFQEIWDEGLFFGEDGANGIRPRSGYLFGVHGKEEMPVMNSGLALMSDLSFTTFQQIEWNEQGSETPTAKGYIRGTIHISDFPICIFNLHTKAGDSDGDKELRRFQMVQLRDAIIDFQVNNPTFIIFVVGDFNIIGETSEYKSLLSLIMKGLKGKDADRNSPGFIIDRNYVDQCTSRESNLLAHWFGTEGNSRLDFIYYIPSMDGTTEVLPKNARVIPFRGHNYSVCVSRIIDPLDIPRCVFPFKYDITNESSDHYAIYAQFRLIRK